MRNEAHSESLLVYISNKALKNEVALSRDVLVITERKIKCSSKWRSFPREHPEV